MDMMMTMTTVVMVLVLSTSGPKFQQSDVLTLSNRTSNVIETPRAEEVEAVVRAATSCSPPDVTCDQMDQITRMTFDRYEILPSNRT